METKEFQIKTHRRGFLGLITASAAAIGLSGMIMPIKLKASPTPLGGNILDSDPMDADLWFNKVKGKHKIVYDAPHPNDMLPFAWPKIFLLTNQQTGTPNTDCGIVVILRHSAIGYAFEDRLWEKYKFGELFNAPDPKTKSPSLRNPFWKPQTGDFKVPGVGVVAIGINELQSEGVMFCVCNVAITVFTAAIAEKLKLNAEEVKKDWMAGLLPGIQVAPSGVWAVGRAQEHGCAYCFAG